MDEQLLEVIRSLIYHGRHFSPSRDAVVIRKSLDRIYDVVHEHHLEMARMRTNIEKEDK